MWELPTSMVGRLHPLWAVAIAILCLTAGLLGGYLLRGSQDGSPIGPPSPNSGSPVLSITAAGTLGTTFPVVAGRVVNESPGAQAPTAAQTYEGSLAALDQISEAHGLYDVAAAADYHLIPELLSPRYATWEALFASTPEVLAYDPSVPALAGINSTNWAGKLLALPAGEYVGFANASSDPNGYNEIFVLELEGILVEGSSGAVYGHFFSGPPGGFAQADPGTVRIEPETEVATLLSEHVVVAYITYRSYALEHHLDFVNFDPRVNLGGFNSSLLTIYAEASTTIENASGASVVVHGAPVAFAITVPTNAPNATLGELFVETLLSSAGAALLTQMGFDPIVPAYGWGSAALPATLQPEVVPAPSSLGLPG